MLKRIFGLKRDERTEGWRKPRSEELRSSYSSRSTIRTIKSRMTRWARVRRGTVIATGGKARGTKTELGGWIILRWILGERMGCKDSG
jgi:hypothetical protein